MDITLDLNSQLEANTIFVFSLVFLMLSLLLSLIEIYISVDALEVELIDLEDIQKKYEDK